MKMQRKWKVIAGVALASVLATGLISSAALADDAEEDTTTTTATATVTPPQGGDILEMGRGEGRQGEGRLNAGINNDAVLDLLGMTQAEIREARQAGQSLVEIAAEQGVTEDQLVATILAEKKAVLDEKVAAGNMTQNEADQMLIRMEERIREQVNRTEAGPNNAQITRGMGQFGTGPGDREMGQGQGQGRGQGKGQARGNNGDCAVDDSTAAQTSLSASRTNLPVGSQTY